MALRKAAAYSKKRTVPFTRKSKKRQKSFVKTVPAQKVAKFNMGKQDISKLPYRLTLVSTEDVQVRHNALESCRQYINKELQKELSDQYHLRIIPYPHHIQRENKMLTGAGADRMQTGMREAYGKASGSAALLHPGSKILFVAVGSKKAEDYARKLIKQIKPKLPCKTRVDQEFKKPE